MHITSVALTDWMMLYQNQCIADFCHFVSVGKNKASRSGSFLASYRTALCALVNTLCLSSLFGAALGILQRANPLRMQSILYAECSLAHHVKNPICLFSWAKRRPVRRHRGRPCQEDQIWFKSVQHRSVSLTLPFKFLCLVWCDGVTSNMVTNITS